MSNRQNRRYFLTQSANTAAGLAAGLETFSAPFDPGIVRANEKNPRFYTC